MVRFLHTSDLHLGKQLNNVSLLKDQEHILDQIVGIARDRRADAVLVAGDIYQRAAPQAEAMALFDRFATALTDAGIKVFAISGNHDSQQRIQYFSGLVQKAGLYIAGDFMGTIQKVELHDEHGAVALYLLPFVKAGQVRRFLGEDSGINSCQDAIGALLASIDLDPSARNLLLCHQFVMGAERSESEENSVGGLDGVDYRLFDAFDYVALGHIHKPQAMGREGVRYAGSPLKYSFSECGHEKSVLLVELGAEKALSVCPIPLEPLHDMKKIRGTIGEIMTMDYSEDYVWVTVTDENVPPDTRSRLLAGVFPNMMHFSVDNSGTRFDMDILSDRRIEDKTPIQLFREFYTDRHGGREPDGDRIRLVEGILKEMEADKREER